MKPISEGRRQDACRRAATVMAWMCIAAGLVVHSGWALGLRRVTSIIPQYVSMKPNTALCFILAGISLLLLQSAGARLHWRRLGHACAVGVTLLGVLTLFEYISGMNLGIDEMLFADVAGAVGTSHPGRMSPATAVGFLLGGLALRFLDAEPRFGWRPAEWLAMLAGMVGFLPLTGYLYGEPELTGMFTPFTRMAVHTAAALTILAVGILCARPSQGVMGLLTGDGIGGLLARFLIPAITTLLVVLGWLRLVGERAGLYSSSQGTALFVVLRVAILAMVIYHIARRVRAVESARDRMEEQLRVLNEELEVKIAERTAEIRQANKALKSERDFADTILRITGALVVVMDGDGRIVRFNRACETTTGYTEAEVLGRPFWDYFLLDEEREQVSEVFHTLRSGNFPLNHENYWKTRDGGKRWIAWSNTCIAQPDGTVTHVIGTGIDITERRQAEEDVRQLNADLERRVRERTAQLDASNKELEAFSYSVSHDLRAPLRSIDGFSKVLLEDYSASVDEQGRDYLQRVRAATQRMGHLIDDMLVLSRVTRSEMTVETTDLSAMARGLVDELRRTEPERRVEVVIQPGMRADVDARLLEIALRNLLGNAWKFTGRTPEARIEFSLHGTEGGVPVYRVRDNGAGFDMAYVDKLFVAFQRLHSANEYAGTGIGLAIVQRVIRRHGGRVWAEGQPGQGASFFFTLAAS